MYSKWGETKLKALDLRKKGYSLRYIERRLKIPKSTLSGWFKDIKLSAGQLRKLKVDHNKALIKGRKSAVLWHNHQKELRLKTAESEAIGVLSKLNINDVPTLEVSLAMLYMGEGFKTQDTGIGNSDPLILRFFMNALVKCYDFDVSKIRCELHLRADQDPDEVKLFWSKELNIPLSSFYSASIDKRTEGRPTYPTYHGVCILRCGNIAIQRRLIYLSKLFCEKIIEKRAVSSAGRASD